MVARARLVRQANTRRRQVASPAQIARRASILHKPHVHRIAMHVRQIHTPPGRALHRRGALATPATLDPTGAHAQIVRQASSRRRQVALAAASVPPASGRQQSRPHRIRVPTVRQARSRGHEPLHARIVSTDNTKMLKDKPRARHVGAESLHATKTSPRPPAHIACLVNSNRIKEQPHACHATLARTKRTREKPFAHPVLLVCSLARQVQHMKTSACSACPGPTLPYHPQPAPSAPPARSTAPPGRARARSVSTPTRKPGTLQTAA